MISSVFIRTVARPRRLVNFVLELPARITTSPLKSRSNVTALPLRRPR